jgi:hypothetical protein
MEKPIIGYRQQFVAYCRERKVPHDGFYSRLLPGITQDEVDAYYDDLHAEHAYQNIFKTRRVQLVSPDDKVDIWNVSYEQARFPVAKFKAKLANGYTLQVCEAHCDTYRKPDPSRSETLCGKPLFMVDRGPELLPYENPEDPNWTSTICGPYCLEKNWDRLVQESGVTDVQ